MRLNFPAEPHMRRCNRCGKAFGSRKACLDHIRDYHDGKGEPVTVHRDREPSIADALVDAELDRAAGLPVAEWIEEMFP